MSPRESAARPRVLGAASGTLVPRLVEAAEIASDVGRPEAAEHLGMAGRDLMGAEARVVVAGEFKQGKSTLVNALLRTEVCPVDADVVTAVPTVLRWGAATSVELQGSSGSTQVAIEDLANWVRGQGPDMSGMHSAIDQVEVRLDRRLLARGITLIDTPGVGGLESAHGQLTRAAVAAADAVLFVTDASQELTAPELAFLRDVHHQCPQVCVVLAKTDLSAAWRRIVELDRAHLQEAGVEAPLITVSSFLRMRAAAHNDVSLNEASGFPSLMALLDRSVLPAADRMAAAAALRELTFVTQQLEYQTKVEQRMLGQGPQAPALVVLDNQRRQVRRATEETSTWMVVLNDGLADLASDVEHDLRERVRRLRAEGETALGSTDPALGWSEFEAWSRSAAARAAVEHLQVLVQRTEELGQQLAERFDVEHQSVDFGLPTSGESVRHVDAFALELGSSRVRQALGALTAARVTYYGVIVTAAIASTAGALVLAPLLGIAVGAGTLFGGRLMREESERQLEYRRARARQAFAAYVDEVTFVLGKESRDAVRRAQRYLRDDFARRARLARHASERTLEVAQQAAVEPADPARVAELRHRQQRLEALGVTEHREGDGT